MVVYRRGELTSHEIITLVLSIAGFIIVLIFLALFYGGLEGEDTREVCRLSVLARATAPTLVQAAVPLKCTTEKICVSMSGKKKDCPQFLGESSVRAVKLNGKTPAENARLIENTSAQAMYQCWSMMGKGKLDLFGKARDLFIGKSTGKVSTCVICSRIAYADDIPPDVFDLVNLEHYLETQFVPLPGATQTYLETFSDEGTKTFASLAEGVKFDALDKVFRKDIVLGSSETRDKQIAFVFSQVKAPSPGTVLKNLGYSVLAGAFAISRVPGSGKVAGATGRAIVTNPYALGATALAVVGVGGGAMWSAYRGQQAAAGYCGQFTTSIEKEEDKLQQYKGGCSLVRATDYNVQDINALCASIQGDP